MLQAATQFFRKMTTPGNQTWQLNIPFMEDLKRNINYNWMILHGQVWLLEGNQEGRCLLVVKVETSFNSHGFGGLLDVSWMTLDHWDKPPPTTISTINLIVFACLLILQTCARSPTRTHLNQPLPFIFWIFQAGLRRVASPAPAPRVWRSPRCDRSQAAVPSCLGSLNRSRRELGA